MARLTWDAAGSHFYEAGVDRGVLYIGAQPGVAWSGLTSVSESPSGGEAEAFYIDGVKHLNIANAEEFEATINAFTYPDEFAICDGTASYYGLRITGQPRVSFGLTYRTKIGNDISGPDYGYKIHIIYNALAEPSQKANNSIGESADAINFSWKITTRPPTITGYQRTAHFIIDSRFTDSTTLGEIEDVLYGSGLAAASLPTPSELLDLISNNIDLIVVDNGDGTWTATGPDSVITMLEETIFQIDSVAATVIDTDTYTLSSP